MSDFDYGNNRYRAEIVRWTDGDTVVLRVDLGQRVLVEGSYRLNRINTPEVHLGPGVTTAQKTAGLALKARLEDAYPPRTIVWIGSKKADRYGRWLVEMWVSESDIWKNLSNWLLAEGLAKPYDGTGPKPV